MISLYCYDYNSFKMDSLIATYLMRDSRISKLQWYVIKDIFRTQDKLLFLPMFWRYCICNIIFLVWNTTSIICM